MRRLGRAIPDELTVITRAKSVPDLQVQLNVMVASLAKHLADMGGASAQALHDEGKALLTQLGQSDADQETTRLAALPQTVADFFALKGELLVALEAINDAGQELHAADVSQAAAYNLKILHRRAGRRSAAGTTAVDAAAEAAV